MFNNSTICTKDNIDATGTHSDGREMSALGKNTKLASLRAKRFYLQAVARELLDGHRVGICNRLTVPGRVVEVWQNPIKQKSHYKNLAVCGSVWVCPVCASKISEKRRQELSGALKDCPYYLFMVTPTFKHDMIDLLPDLRFDFKATMKRFFSGAGWVSLQKKYGIIGHVTGTETNLSRVNGWHLHEHILFFSTIQPVPGAIQEDFFKRYKAILESFGRFASFEHGLKVSMPSDAVSELYPSKWGLEDELTKSNVKKARAGFSPFQLLELYSNGEKWIAPYFREYARAMKGVHQLQWSSGLRELLGLDVEKSDELLAVEKVETGDILLAKLSSSDWMCIISDGVRGELLDIADSGDVEKFEAFLSAHGVNNRFGGWLG